MTDNHNLQRYEVIPANAQYLDQIIELFEAETGRTLSKEKIKELIKTYPSMLLLFGSCVVGFVYSGRLAPDILELMNIYISKQHQNKCYGRILLEKIELEAKKEYNAIVAINSLLYTDEDKRLATNFYLRNGYELVFNTQNTNIFAKAIVDLPSLPE